MLTPATPRRVAKAETNVGRMTNEPRVPTGHAIDPDEVGVSLLGDRLLAAARIASTMHAQATSLSAHRMIGATR